MAIKKFATKSEYNSATLSNTESTVSLIETGNEIIVNGVNVRTKEPVLGDAVYADANNNVVYIKLESLTASLIPAGWTYIGIVIENRTDGVLICYGRSFPDNKFLGVCEYVLNDVGIGGAGGTLTFGLRFGTPNWDTTSSISVTYSGSDDEYQVREKIENAIKAACPSNQVDEWEVSVGSYGSTASYRIYRRNCTDYRFYNCTGLTHNSWLDMPENSSYMKVNGQVTNYRGLQNIARGKAYWSTNGRTPDSTVNVGSEAGNTSPVTLSAFTSSNYCNKLRAAYSTYDDYLKGEFGIDPKQKYGCFGLPTGEELTKKYGPMKVNNTPRYPALNWAYELNLNIDGMRAGDWHLWDVRESTIIMKDENLTRIDLCLTKAGMSALGNSAYRWFAQRYSVNCAWFFYGYDGHLNGSYVSDALQCGAVTLLKK